MTGTEPRGPELAGLRTEVAQACRVLAARRLAPGILGHVSVRVDAERLLIRCRGPEERGLAETTSADIRLIDFDGNPAESGELDDGYRVPNELALHTGILRRRSDVTAVVHAHPRTVVAADLAGLEVAPVVGAYDIPSAQLAAGGVPVYPRSVLIRTAQLADEVADVLGERRAAILRGHGLVATGSSVPEAVLGALSVDTICSLLLTITAAGGVPRPIPEDDLAELPVLGRALNVDAAWRHELVRTDAYRRREQP